MSSVRRVSPARHNVADLPAAVLLDLGAGAGTVLEVSGLIVADAGAAGALASVMIIGGLEAAALPTTIDARAHCEASCDSRALDQFLTAPEIASQTYHLAGEHYDLAQYQLIDPSAGRGAHLSLMPKDAIGIDVNSPICRVLRADFLTTVAISYRPIGIVGNPPFGRNSNLAIAFFNHAARFAAFVAFVFPKTACKPWFQNRLDCSFHLVHEIVLLDRSFLFEGKRCNVPAVFQIWERRCETRKLWTQKTFHSDFKFLSKEDSERPTSRSSASVRGRAGCTETSKDCSRQHTLSR